MSITFNSWIYLLGALTALIPLVIHLSRSRRTKKMRFSTTRFFTDQFLRSYRMSRLREIVLLVCRMALFALLAVALAQPLLKLGSATTRSSKDARTVVLVIDNSASMNYTENETTLLDRARAAARSLIDNLHRGDRVGIVLAGRLPTGPEVLLEPTEDRNDALQALDGIAIVRREKDQPDRIRALGTDMQGALTRAELMVKNVDTPAREIYVFSDLQASGWDLPEEDAAPAEAADIGYVFVQIRPQQPIKQVAVTAVQVSSPRPLVGVPFLFRPVLGLQGDLGTASLRASLWVYEKDKDGQWIHEKDRDGKDTRQRRVRMVADQEIQRLPSGRWKLPRLYCTFHTPGWQAGYVEVGYERGFKITDQTLGGLRKEKVPEDVLAKLNPLKDQDFAREQLQTELSRILTRDNEKQFLDKVVNQAKSAPASGETAQAGTPRTIDGRRYFALEVLESVKVLAVNGAPSQVPLQDELFFLRFGLAVSEGEKSSFEMEEIGPANLAEKMQDVDKFRAEFPLVLLANVESLPDAALAKLEEYTAQGGSVLFFLGDKVNANHYNENMAAASRRLGGLLPAKLVKIESGWKLTDQALAALRSEKVPEEVLAKLAPLKETMLEHQAFLAELARILTKDERDRFLDLVVNLARNDPATKNAWDAFVVSRVADDHPALTAFKDPKFAPLTAVHFKSLWRVEAEPASILIKADNDAPLLCEKAYGKGRVMVFASSCHTNWTDLPGRNAFLPFLHRVVMYLALRPGNRRAFGSTDSEIVLLSNALPGTPIMVRRPSGESEAPTGNDSQTGEPTYARADQPGIYSLVTPEEKEVGLFAVNLDNYESDLTYLDDLWTEDLDNPDAAKRQAVIEEGLKKQLNRQLVSYVADPTTGAGLGGAGRGVRLWDWILVIVLVIGVFEPYLANQISSRLTARKPPTLNLPRPGASATAHIPADSKEVLR
jgi:von Willebrand factor type A domain/Aerotolerance regulator N-terminal